MAMTIVEAARGVTGGVDTHLDVHVAAALDPLGALLGSEPFATTPAGYKQLLGWLEGFGDVAKIGIEGTGSYGAGLARFLRRRGVEVIEVDRQNRQARRRSGKSDPLDAIEAARAALGGRAQGHAKSKDGAVEAIRVLVIAKRSARQARVKALTQMRHLTVTAPDQLRCRLRGLTVPTLVAEGAKLRPGRSTDPVTSATKASISSLAHRIQSLEREIDELDELLQRLAGKLAQPGRQALRDRIRLVRPERGRVPLPDGAAPRVLALNVLHHINDDPATLAEIVRVLAPGGRLVVIDFGDIDRPVGPPREHVLPHDELRAVVTGMGLRETAFHEPGDLLVYHVVVVAEKPER